MIKLTLREMKKISRILTMVLCCAPLGLVYASPVATTNGSNLTAYNPSNANNNQWATISNGRYDANTNTSVKANFGNCNSIVLRCAQPKCSNGGCSDISVASAIVNGCVQSNESCKQYGDDLVNYMSAQLVASSNAKLNEQQLAAQQAAAAAASAESQQQMAAMQQQMQQMQQQMVQQQQESAQQIQQALAQQQAQSAAALEEMKSAATDAAKQTEAGISSYQQDAINRGISADVLERQTMTGQIMTEIEDAETSMTDLKKTLQNTFEYAKCDSRGNNCEGPKRVKKWREMAKEFVEPYNNVIDKIYTALQDAQMLGVDLSQIYMMLDNSCNSWGQYMCPQMTGGTISYNFDENNAKSKPMVCPSDTQQAENIKNCIDSCDYTTIEIEMNGSKSVTKTPKASCVENCRTRNGCVACTMLKVLSGEDAVYEGWVNAESDAGQSNTTVVACASGVLDGSKFFASRARRKNGANLVDVEVLDTWLNQTEPGYRQSSTAGNIREGVIEKYCFIEGAESVLEKATLSKVAPVNGFPLCVNDLGSKKENTQECPFISPVYAICDTHPYNAGRDKITGKDSTSLSEQVNDTKKMVGLKTTVVSQQMYKQYEYLNATLRRLKIQLEKAIVKTNLEAAGAKDSNTSSSNGLLGSGSNDDKKVVLADAENCANSNSSSAVYKCLQNNISVIIANASSNRQKACTQLANNITWAGTWSIKLDSDYSDCGTACGKDRIVECSQALNQKVIQKIEEKETTNRSYPGYYIPAAQQN